MLKNRQDVARMFAEHKFDMDVQAECMPQEGASQALYGLMFDSIAATLQAERSSIRMYLDMLQELEEMPDVSFRYYDEDGRRVVVNIPVLTLVPISRLHIEEATFDFSGSLETDDKEEEDSMATNSAEVRHRDPLTKDPETGTSNIKFLGLSGRGVRRTVRMNFRSSSSSKAEKQNSNLKVYIKMGQSSMPKGLLEMLSKKNSNVKLEE